jgi:hypothetical protein
MNRGYGGRAEGEQETALVVQTTSRSLAHAQEDDPVTVEEALAGPDASEWRQAIRKELASIHEHDVYDVVPRPVGKSVVKSKFVFRRKLGPSGSVEKFKARLVAKGFTQQPGVDYDETFAPTAKFVTIRTVLSLAARFGWQVEQVDVQTAFLNGQLEEEIFLQPPEGVDIKPDHVWRLKKALYGLKQGPRVWNSHLHNVLTAASLAFRRTVGDHTLYVRGSSPLDKDYCILVVYVDDMVIAGHGDVVQMVKEKIKLNLDTTELGPIHWLLGVQVQRDKDGSFFLSQEHYIKSVLERFGMQSCRPVSTPLASTKQRPISSLLSVMPFTTNDNNSADIDVIESSNIAHEDGPEHWPYRQVLGCLMYLMMATRPDMAAVVSYLGRFMENPQKQHWIAVKRVLRYLAGTANWKLKLAAGATGHKDNTNLQILAYCDADWAGDLETRRSMSGFVVSLGVASKNECGADIASISWRSKHQPVVALSTTEAEYVAISEVCREVMWLKGILRELGFEEQEGAKIKTDNQGAIALIKNPVHHQRTKHIDIKHHFIRDLYEKKEIELQYEATEKQVADIFTKGLSVKKHLFCCKEMGLVS